MSKEKKYGAIGVLTFTMMEAGSIPLTNLVKVLSFFSHKIYVITGADTSHPMPYEGNIEPLADCTIRNHKYRHAQGKNVFTRILRYIFAQLKICYMLIMLRRKVNLWVLSVGGEGLLLPILTVKCLGKNVVLALPGSGVKVARAKKDPLWRCLWLLNRINFALSDRIIVTSSRAINELGLERHRKKTVAAYEASLDFNEFQIRKTLDERGNLVGYIGRFGREKGIMNFLEAIPKLLDEKPDINFLIGGVGELQSQVEQYLRNTDLKNRVDYVGWIPHDKLPDYLNDLRLFVIPSYTEGQPTILLEAMACGTPVLAAPVGIVPDIIEDGETGFRMEDNSPECIARNIIRALNYPNPGDVVMKAHAVVEKRCTYEAVVAKWEGALAGLKLS